MNYLTKRHESQTKQSCLRPWQKIWQQSKHTIRIKTHDNQTEWSTPDISLAKFITSTQKTVTYSKDHTTQFIK